MRGEVGIGLLVAAHVFFNLYYPQLNIGVWKSSWWTATFVGVLISQPVLIACITTLGSGPALVRVSSAPLVLCAVALSNTWSGLICSQLANGIEVLVIQLCLVPVFLVAAGTLAWIRRACGWSLKLSLASLPPLAPGLRFGVRQLMLWISAAAVVSAVASGLLRAFTPYTGSVAELAPMVLFALIAGLPLGFLALPGIFLLAGCLAGQEKRWCFKATLIVVVTKLGLSYIVLDLPYRFHPQNLVVFGGLVVGFYTSILVSAVCLRGIGYRLSVGSEKSVAVNASVID